MPQGVSSEILHNYLNVPQVDEVISEITRKKETETITIDL